MNKPVLYLRIASVLTFIHAVLHTVGGEDRSWARRHGRRGDESEYVSAYGKRKKLLDVLSGDGPSCHRLLNRRIDPDASEPRTA